MTSKLPAACIFILSALTVLAGPACAAGSGDDISEQMKESLVYVNVTAYSYPQLQPWRQADLRDNAGYGCAVGPYQVLTTAWNVVNATFIKVRRYGQNEFIPATVSVIDYESNLCLLDLDRNTMKAPLKPIEFSERYRKGAQLKSYWLTSGGHLETGRGYLDRAEVNKSSVSYTRFLNYVATNTTAVAARASVYCLDSKPIGIACWADTDSQEAGLIPAETINRFLSDADGEKYDGFATVGFATRTLIDPVMRTHLKLPDDLSDGVYVADTFTLGTACEELQKGDVIVAIDSKRLDAYGQYEHDRFDRVSYHHLVTSHRAGDEITFDIWRDGKAETVTAGAKRFDASEMLVPYYEYGKQPNYLVTAGFVFQRLTRDYLQLWGDNWTGNVPPHLYHYYRDMAFNPTDQRSEIVVLSYVLPADINLGYQKLGRLVVSSVNGKDISSLADFLKARTLNPDSKYDVIEFENDYPTVVIDRSGLPQADMLIAQRYGIRTPMNVKQ